MVETRSTTHDLGGSPSKLQEQHQSTWIREKGGLKGAKTQARSLTQGGLSVPQLYVLLGLAYALLSLPLMFGPRTTAHWLYGSAARPVEDQHGHTLGLVATTLVTIVSAAFALEEASRKHTKRSAGPDVLRTGLAAYALLSLATHFFYPATLSPLAAVLVLLTHGTTLVLLGSQARVSPPDSAQRGAQTVADGARAALRLPHGSILGRLYLLLSLAAPALGALVVLVPQTSLYHTLGYVYGASTLLPWKLFGVGMLTIAPAVTLTLKDKAEAGLLSRSIPRTLNAGLLGASLGHLLIFGPILAQAHGGALLPFIVLGATLATLTAILGFTAPELEELAEAALAEPETEEAVHNPKI
ncbi:hypothetical protein ACKKBG_A26210 [Auxenochlorella protothecoides x Auxenochlorella symbiontica]